MQLTNVVIAVAVLAYVLYRQVIPRQVREGRLYTIPLVLLVLGVAQGHLVDPAHRSPSVVLLVAEAACALVFGAYRASTMKIWRDEKGVLWRQGTVVTVLAWVASIAARIGLAAVGTADHVKAGNGGILMFLGLTLLVQNAIVDWRAGTSPNLRRATFNR
jgi:FtsH-binding integral membrane protein